MKGTDLKTNERQFKVVLVFHFICEKYVINQKINITVSFLFRFFLFLLHFHFILQHMCRNLKRDQWHENIR